MTITLITGANRGLGFGLVTALAKRPNHTIIAGVRDPSAANALKELASQHGVNVDVVKLVADSAQDIEKAAEFVKGKYGKLDSLIANAGIAEDFLVDVQDLTLDSFRKHVEVNLLGPFTLFQKFRELLQKGDRPQVMLMSSSSGSISSCPPLIQYAYASTKAGANMLFQKIHQAEKEWLSVLIVHPGFVQTDMGNHGAVKLGMKEAFITTQESVVGLLKILDDNKLPPDAHYWDASALDKPIRF